MDEYIVKICKNKEVNTPNLNDYYFYKNGLLHREAGPAILFGLTEKEFEQLEDRNLYKKQFLWKKSPPGYEARYVRATPPAIRVLTYYLNGMHYKTEKEFNSTKINKELEKELPLIESNNKKKQKNKNLIMDKYIVKKCLAGTGSFFFYKNGLLHREAGPAIIMSQTISPNLNLGDENLYITEFLAESQPQDYVRDKVVKSVGSSGLGKFVTAIYYLEGQPYTKEEFEQLKAKIDLKENLSSELIINQNPNNKRTKI